MIVDGAPFLKLTEDVLPADLPSEALSLTQWRQVSADEWVLEWMPEHERDISI